jgi:hypothetical protein
MLCIGPNIHEPSKDESIQMNAEVDVQLDDIPDEDDEVCSKGSSQIYYLLTTRARKLFLVTSTGAAEMTRR